MTSNESPPANPSKPISFLLRMRIEITAALGAFILRMLHATIRWRVLEPTMSLGLDKRTGPRIIAFWHQQQLVVAPIYTISGIKKGSKGLCALSSRHKDGQISARALEWFGFRTIMGSSSKGGAMAVRSLLEVINEGLDLGITPDGPRGPPHEIKDGIVKLAQLAQVPIYPIAMSVQRRWTFGSWDRMFLPKPFTKGVYVVGRPISVPRRLSDDDFRRVVHTVEEGLRVVNTQVDTYEFA